jgi:hypothetical protein
MSGPQKAKVLFGASQMTAEKKEHPDVLDSKGSRMHPGALSRKGWLGWALESCGELRLYRLTIVTTAEGFVAIEQKNDSCWSCRIFRSFADLNSCLFGEAAAPTW